MSQDIWVGFCNYATKRDGRWDRAKNTLHNLPEVEEVVRGGFHYLTGKHFKLIEIQSISISAVEMGTSVDLIIVLVVNVPEQSPQQQKE